MKCQIPEISWHNRDPVLSVDIQPKVDGKIRLASGGTDSHVLIWYLTHEDGVVSLDLAADLTRHQRAVNCVRWSPNGEYLASSDDESVIFVWRQKPESETLNILDKDSTNDQDKEIWLTMKILRGHMEDVYDLSWSPNSNFLLSGSVDNTAIVWDVQKGKNLTILHDHKGFVQGVSWDPLNAFLATISTDRIFRMFDVNTKKIVNRCSKTTLPVPNDHSLHDKQVRLFHDDTLQTFFRRLVFSPDGNLIVVPSGVIDVEDSNLKPLNSTYIFTRNSLKRPSVVLPSPDQFSVAVRFCPLLFELKPNKKKPVINLPYRMIFAVATKSSVYLYDTQQKIPFGLISNIHYTRLTDLTWSNDGTVLIVSSTDGYCSIVQFNENELGVVYKEKTISEILVANTPKVKEKKGADKAKNSEAKKNFSLTPQTIAIRKKPKAVVEQKTVEETETAPAKKDDEKEEKAADVPILQTSVNIDGIIELIPVDKIIRSDEKFESPEKKNSPVTPIPIRKHPRTATPTTTISANEENAKKETPPNENNDTTAVDQSTITPKTKKLNTISKTPTPIAIRRKPRILQPEASNNVQQSSEKMEVDTDVWPIDESKPEKAQIKEKVDHQPHQQMETELKADEPSKSDTPKTPRRVEFRTLSTPKSKKKLIAD